ncbi:MAG: HEAT repeat domain-containing protein [Planctomycetaceae bacterium]|nr:HEAT repeat domain-containing protein [Planctomycetaceae bacterium]
MSRFEKRIEQIQSPLRKRRRLASSQAWTALILTAALLVSVASAFCQDRNANGEVASDGVATLAGTMTHMIVFGPTGDFSPRNGMDYLNLANPKHAEFGVRSSYFRPKMEDGKLIAYFLTSTPDGFKKMIESIPQFEYIRTERLTQEMFDAYEKTPQESLPSPRMPEIEQSDWYQKLTGLQKRYVQWDESLFAYAYDPEDYDVGNDRDAFEQRWLEELAKPEPGHPGFNRVTPYMEAILGLAMIKSDKALQPLVKIAAEKVIKDNAHRHYATKALGMLGNPAAIPELIPLVYHFNMNTRLDAQVSLVRLTGQNFGNDAQAWGEWYMENRDKLGENLPEFDATPVDWTLGSNNSELRRWSDLKAQEEFDNRHFGEQ